MNKEEFYIKIIQPIREFCSHSDKEDVYMYIYNLQQENKKLKDNWNKLKNCMIDIFNITQEIYYLDLLETMQELEKGDSNGQ